MNGLYIGIDGGASGTRVALCSRDGGIISRCEGPPSNPNDIGTRAAARIIKNVTDGLFEKRPSDRTRVLSVFAGISGALGHPVLADALRGMFDPAASSLVGSDALNVLYCGLFGGDGCCLISGSGSVCFARVGGELHRIGGWGWLLDCAGSGYHIGRDGIEAILRAGDGRGEATLLSGFYEERFSSPAWDDIARIYAEGRGYIASFAPMVLKAADMSDHAAQRIIEKNMGSLAEYIDAAAVHFSAGFDVALGGGILENSPLAVRVLTDSIRCGARAKVIPTAPVFGAVARAMELRGISAGPCELERFKADYGRVKAKIIK